MSLWEPHRPPDHPAHVGISWAGHGRLPPSVDQTGTKDSQEGRAQSLGDEMMTSALRAVGLQALGVGKSQETGPHDVANPEQRGVFVAMPVPVEMDP